MGGKNKNKSKRPRSLTDSPSPTLARRATKAARATLTPTPSQENLTASPRTSSGESTANATSPDPTPSTSGVAAPTSVLSAQPIRATQDNLNNFSSPFASSNRFTALSSVPNDEEITQPKPPPIYISNVTDIAGMIATLTTQLGPASFTYKARSSDVAFYPRTPEHYRKAVRFLRENKISYFTYQMKQEKAYRVVIRHLHPSTPTNVIRDELESKGFHVKNIAGVKHRTTKEYLPLFFVDLKPHPNNKAIFDLNELYYCKVKVEEPYKNQDIVQCKRCQALGHTRNHCNLPERCVKCAGTHATENCLKKREEAPKCVLCGGSHPASYRGCQVHTELQLKLRKSPKLMGHRVNRDTTQGPLPASAVHHHQASNTTSTALLEEVINPINDVPTISYAAATKKGINSCEPLQPRPNPQHFIPPPSLSNDIVTALSSALTTALSSFLSELRNAITPLVNLLTHVSTVLPLHFPNK